MTSQARPGEEHVEVRKRRPFSAVPDDILTNCGLSERARLLLAWMIGRPDGWNFYVTQIRATFRLSKEQWRAARRELEKCGYWLSERKRNASGKLTWRHFVFDEPNNISPGCVFPPMVKPEHGEPCPEKHHPKTKDFKQRNEAAAPRALAHESAAAALDAGKRRRERPSGVVTWDASDVVEAERIEADHDPSAIRVAVSAIVTANREPVPGRVAAELVAMRRRAEHEARKVAADAAQRQRLAAASHVPLDPAAMEAARARYGLQRRRKITST